MSILSSDSQLSSNMHAFRSPGYALSLLAESTTGALHCSEAVSKPGIAPEEVALEASRALLSEIRNGGCVDRRHQSLVLILMVLGSEDVGRIRMSEPTERTFVSITHFTPIRETNNAPHRIQLLRDIRDAFGTSFKISPADKSGASSDLTYVCYGTGYINTNRSVA